MELKQFIYESLKQISEAISEVKSETKGGDFVINPYVTERFDGISSESEYVGLAKGERLIQNINFDIAITVETGKEKNGEIKVAGGGLSAGFFGSKKNRESSVSRLKFAIPISLPTDYMK